MQQPGQAGPGALAPRGGIRLRAGQHRRWSSTVRAALDDDGKPADWTTEIWSGRRTTAPGSGGNLLGAPRRCPIRRPRRRPPTSGIEWRRRHPQRRAALRFPAEAHRASPDRRDAGADLVVARARRDARTCSRSNACIDELAARAGQDPVRTGCRSLPTRAPAPSSSRSPRWPGGRPALRRHRPRPRHRLRAIQEPRRLCGAVLVTREGNAAAAAGSRPAIGGQRLLDNGARGLRRQ